MNRDLVENIARAVLYEGYILYPYRPCVKSRQRWTFGGIFPFSFCESHKGGDSASMQAQCLLVGAGDSTSVSVELRFLHLMDRMVEQAPAFERVACMRVGNSELHSWQEAVERSVTVDGALLNELLRESKQMAFSFSGSRATELLRENDQTVGRLVREQQAIAGTIELLAARVSPDAIQLTIRILNTTPAAAAGIGRDQALLRSFASTHMIVHTAAGQFISLTDPPVALREVASQCQNTGCWPVLVGEAIQTDAMLVSPIILPDYPQIAAESPGDLFDGTEIDEILTLRIMTLTDEEKSQAAAVDERVRTLLERTESLAREQLMNLHGAVRGMHPIVKEASHA